MGAEAQHDRRRVSVCCKALLRAAVGGAEGAGCRVVVVVTGLGIPLLPATLLPGAQAGEDVGADPVGTQREEM